MAGSRSPGRANRARSLIRAVVKRRRRGWGGASVCVTLAGGEGGGGRGLRPAARRLDYSGVAMLAAFGRSRARVFRKRVVAILATGDEIVEVDEQPRDFQIRNSNAQSLAVQVARAG